MSISMHLRNVAEDTGSRAAGDEANWRHDGPELGPDAHFSAHAVPLNGFVPAAPTLDELQLVQKVFFLGGKESPRVAVFCGVEPSDGADLVCARAAEVLSGLVTGTVCLMDADLRSPTLHLRYDIDDSFRFDGSETEVDDEESGRLRGPNLWVLPASALKDSRSGLGPDIVRNKLEMLRERFEFLLISAPPLARAAEGFLLGQMADGVVLTTLAHSTPRAKTLKVRRSLETYNIRVLAAVLNEPPGNRRR